VSVTRFADAVAALYAAYQAAPALAGVPVSNTVTPTAYAAADFVIIGHDASMDGDGILQPAALAGTYTQDLAYMPDVTEERGSINVIAVSQSPDITAVAATQARVTVLVAACEDAADAASAPHLKFDGTSDGRFITRQGANGLAVICAFRVGYSTPWG
jgi:hypothetical protein